MSDYRKGDALAITQPDGSRHTFRVMAVAPDPVDPDALSFTLRRIDGPPHRQPPSLAPEALAAASGSVIGVVPLAQKLAEYRVHPAPTEGLAAISIEHAPCTWYDVVQFDGHLPQLVALALEHHLAGCKVMQPGRRAPR